MTKVLVVDDVKDNIVLLTFELEDDGFDVVSARSGEECLKIVEIDKPDIILLDIGMPGMSGTQTLYVLKKDDKTSDIPVIMVSANDSEKDVIEAIDLGAHDFVSKPIEYPVLAARMRSALRLSQALAELEKVNSELNTLATTDTLTGCHNRRQFFSLSETEAAKSVRHDRKLAVMMIDIDFFKQINDSYGHAAGDMAIEAICDCCRKECRESDIFGRLGGEEFALSCPDADIEGALKLAERIRYSCEKLALEFNEHTFKLTVSIGVTSLHSEDKDFSQALQRADEFLYKAKKQGRNCVISDRESPTSSE
jgi:diguanylate cyclase (GGDEF)-like protein